MERPPPRATLPPLRQRLHTPESQRRLLQEQLMGVSFYRHLVSSEDDALLLRTLEAEFDGLIANAPSLQSDGVFCLRFPSLGATPGFLIKRLSERYHLQAAAFGEDESRFMVVYLHPRDCMAPVLRLDDFVHAKSYYMPPPPPAAQYEPRKQQRRAGEGYELEAEELPLTQDYSWARSQPASGVPPRVGYECEIAGCHDHMIELRPCGSFPEHTAEKILAKLEELITAGCDGLVVLRELPAGCVGIFASAASASTFLESRHAVCESGSESNGFVKVRLSSADLDGKGGLFCDARPLAALGRRHRTGGADGPPRALQSALRGLGQVAPRGRGNTAR